MRLEVDELTVSYGTVPVLRGVSLRAEPGRLLGIVGPNGAGKSTLLKAVLGLVEVDAGHVTVGGRPVADQRGLIAYLPQRAEIDWDYPAVVGDVVAMGRYPHRGLLRRIGRTDRERIAVALDRVGLSPLADRPIGELSGGQRQRMLLARALAQEARLVLLDEPFAAIDALTESLIRERLRELRDDGVTVVMVDHDLARAPALYDDLVLLARHVVAAGPPAEVLAEPRLAEAYGIAPGTP